MRIAIIAALPGELKPLVKGWKRVATNERGITKWALSRGADTWIAVCAGMGADAALRAYANAVSDGPVDMLLSVGWAGSLHAEVPAGTVQIPTIVIDAQTGEQFRLTEGKRKWRLVTTVRVADESEKARLAATYRGAVLVDMEAATVARLADMHGIPLLCIKGVSDAAGANRYVPGLFTFFSDDSRVDELRSYAKNNLPPASAPEVTKVVDEIQFRAEFKKRLAPQLNSWIDKKTR